MTDTNNECIYEIKENENGMGLYALKRIQRGELILAEKPILKLRQNVPQHQLKIYVEDEVSKLSDEEKSKIFELFDYNSPKTAIGIFSTNGYMLGKKSDYCGLFYLISRINHSCRPNVCHHWCENEGVQKIFALREIEIGQEILTSYIDLYQDTESRKRQLKKLFNFTCNCELCSIEDEDLIEKSDERRRLLNELESFRPKMGLRSPELFLSKKKQLLKFLKEEGIDYDAFYVNKCAYDVFAFLFKTNANRESLKYWANLVYENSLICQGEVKASLKKEILVLCGKDS
ncbi:unnamed protein product [Brachionus calyciflorus]|uniref:SET domain-containing protein n=1 Tax=Brachionus calyciflorus TaxID=104777 RepID=A0A814NBN6_9BILA|nr:unnamed protein product [Brachionus calyciflorus]